MIVFSYCVVGVVEMELFVNIRSVRSWVYVLVMDGNWSSGWISWKEC